MSRDSDREDAEMRVAEDRAEQRRDFVPERPDRDGRDADWNYVREYGATLTREGW